jgi:hypothetical protein
MLRPFCCGVSPKPFVVLSRSREKSRRAGDREGEAPAPRGSLFALESVWPISLLAPPLAEAAVELRAEYGAAATDAAEERTCGEELPPSPVYSYGRVCESVCDGDGFLARASDLDLRGGEIDASCESGEFESPSSSGSRECKSPPKRASSY